MSATLKEVEKEVEAKLKDEEAKRTDEAESLKKLLRETLVAATECQGFAFLAGANVGTGIQEGDKALSRGLVALGKLADSIAIAPPKTGAELGEVKTLADDSREYGLKAVECFKEGMKKALLSSANSKGASALLKKIMRGLGVENTVTEAITSSSGIATTQPEAANELKLDQEQEIDNLKKLLRETLAAATECQGFAFLAGVHVGTGIQNGDIALDRGLVALDKLAKSIAIAPPKTGAELGEVKILADKSREYGIEAVKLFKDGIALAGLSAASSNGASAFLEEIMQGLDLENTVTAKGKVTSSSDMATTLSALQDVFSNLIPQPEAAYVAPVIHLSTEVSSSTSSTSASTVDVAESSVGEPGASSSVFI